MSATAPRQPVSPSTGWEQLTTRERCRRVAAVAGRVCDRAGELIEACASPQRTEPVETITAELMPLCAALKFIGRRGPKVLATRRMGAWGRPLWLWGVRSVVRRRPLGRVLVLGTWNYPLLLPGVQVAQALAAGNSVRLKPAPGAERASQLLVDCFEAAGVPRGQLHLLSSSTAAAVEAIESGVDLVVLTGSATTGRKVLHQAADQLAASIMELSGCDAVIALPGFAPQRLLAAIAFGLRFNSGATCIGPRRLLVSRADHGAVVDGLCRQLAQAEAVTVHEAARSDVAQLVAAALEAGAVDCLGRFDAAEFTRTGRLRPLVLDRVPADQPIAAADVFAPVMSVMEYAEVDEAVKRVNGGRYRLAASVFGPERAARELASRLDVGVVTVNDLIVPTADPRLPFGGRGESGFGVTRGPEGLLAMTTPQVESVRRGRLLPHLRTPQANDRQLLEGVLQWGYADSLGKRWEGLRRVVQSGRSQSGRSDGGNT